MINAANLPDEGLTTERVILRAVSEDHARALQAYYAANRIHLQPWEPAREESFFNLDTIADRLRAMARQTAAGHALHLALFECEGGQLIGNCDFTNIVRGPFQACHLGFSIAKAAEGKGLMSESLTTAIQHVFTNIGLHRIMANYRPENTRSGRLLANLGFEKEGLARSYLKINGSWTDHVLTSRVNPDDPA